MLVVLIKADELFYLTIQVPACFFLGFCKACSGALGHRWEKGQKCLQNKPLCYLLTLLGSLQRLQQADTGVSACGSEGLCRTGRIRLKFRREGSGEEPRDFQAKGSA